MLFVLHCKDGPDGTKLRHEHRPAHLKYLDDAGDRVKLAGPLLSGGEDGKPIGRLIVVDAASEAAVKLFAETDPYAKAGVFESVTIHPFRPSKGVWPGAGA